MRAGLPMLRLMKGRTVKMKGEKGRLVCVWSPLLHREGCSTLACSLGFGLHRRSAGRVLIVDRSGSISGINSFLEKDIEIRYSIDNLKIFGPGIRADHIKAYGTQVNTELYMLAGSRLEKEPEIGNCEFDRHFIGSCLEGFDLVIVDVGAGMTERKDLYLDSADCIISVCTPDEVMLDQMLRGAIPKSALGHFSGEKTVHVFNKLHSSWEVHSVVGRYRRRYGLKKAFGFEYDGDLLNACCSDRKLYSFLTRRSGDRSCVYMKQLEAICSFVAGELSLAEKHAEAGSDGGLFSRLRRISLY